MPSAPAAANAADVLYPAAIVERNAGDAVLLMRMSVRNAPFTRPRSAAGTSRCRGMNAYTMCALHASCRPVTASRIICHDRANAAAPLESAASETTMSIVSPSGRPRARRGANAEPKIWMTPVNDRARPIVTASSLYCSRRTNSRRVFIPWLPRLLMNIRTKSARSTVLRQMKVKPSPTSLRTLATVSGATVAGSTSFSGGIRMNTTSDGR